MADALSLYSGLIWFVLLLLPLVFLQRRFHREIMAVLLLITRKENVTMLLFAILFLPGVFLHELSHWLLARLLGVRTSKFSLLPEWLPEGSLRLGYVEVQRVDLLREALIGTAPLILGGAFVAYAGLYQLELDLFWDFVVAGGRLPDAIADLYARPDFWLWLYLTFVVSSTMMPSETDRRAWLPISVFVGFVAVLAFIAGGGPWMLENLATPVNNGLLSLSVVFAISAALHLVFLLPTLLFRRLLNRVTGLQVVS